MPEQIRHLKVHLMHMMNLNHMAPVVHLNIDGKDEWFIFVQENIFRSLMWALIGIKSEVSASDLMHRNCVRGGRRLFWVRVIHL